MVLQFVVSVRNFVSELTSNISMSARSSSGASHANETSVDLTLVTLTLATEDGTDASVVTVMSA